VPQRTDRPHQRVPHHDRVAPARASKKVRDVSLLHTASIELRTAAFAYSLDVPRPDRSAHPLGAATRMVHHHVTCIASAQHASGATAGCGVCIPGVAARTCRIARRAYLSQSFPIHMPNVRQLHKALQPSVSPVVVLPAGRIQQACAAMHTNLSLLPPDHSTSPHIGGMPNHTAAPGCFYVPRNVSHKYTCRPSLPLLVQPAVCSTCLVN
jgi:hypothetical protein